MGNKQSLVWVSAFCLAAGAGSVVAVADEIADFYKGKQIRHIIGSGSGGAYDTYSRMVGRYITNHIPGNPTIVPQSMPGGGSRKAASWIYNAAPKDGSVLGTVSQNIPVDQALEEQKTEFDASKFNWIGTPTTNNHILIVWHTSGVGTIEDAMKKEITVGGSGGNSPSVLIPKLANMYIGTKFKIISGYRGGEDVMLAIERQEVDGRGAMSWQSLRNNNAEWVKDKKVSVILQAGVKKEIELPDVPLLSDLAKSEDNRAILTFLSATVAFGRPILTTPGVPAERLAALRRAFDATMRDAEFLAEAKKRNMDVNPTSGEDLQALAANVANTPVVLIRKIKTEAGITGSGE